MSSLKLLEYLKKQFQGHGYGANRDIGFRMNSSQETSNAVFWSENNSSKGKIGSHTSKSTVKSISITEEHYQKQLMQLSRWASFQTPNSTLRIHQTLHLLTTICSSRWLMAWSRITSLLTQKNWVRFLDSLKICGIFSTQNLFERWEKVLANDGQYVQ